MPLKVYKTILSQQQSVNDRTLQQGICSTRVVWPGVARQQSQALTCLVTQVRAPAGPAADLPASTSAVALPMADVIHRLLSVIASSTTCAIAAGTSVAFRHAHLLTLPPAAKLQSVVLQASIQPLRVLGI